MNRINELIKSGQSIFRTDDLALLWQISNRSTLYTTIQRLLKQGVLTRIYKGLYTTARLDQLDPVLLGQKAVHDYVYLSTETVLIQAGALFQSIPYLTYITTKPLKLTILGQEYRYRQMRPHYLHNQTGVVHKQGLFQASPERAMADLLYFNRRAHLDNQRAVDWHQVKIIQKQIGYV